MMQSYLTERTQDPEAVRGKNAIRSLQCIVYLTAALALGYFTFMSMMWSVWGAPILPVHYLALFGALGLFVSAPVSLGSPSAGRALAILSLLALGTLWVPAVVSLVPQHNVIVSPLALCLVAAYFVTVGFALLYPTRWKWSVPAFLFVLGTAVTLAAVTGIRRVHSGEYSRPSLAYFRWFANGDGLVVEGDDHQWIDSETKTLLQRSGIHGRLQWKGSSGQRSAAHRVILLVQRQLVTSYHVYYPRVGTLTYAFDGSQWRTIPTGAATYPSYATLEPEGASTMLLEDVGGGRAGTTAFMW